MLAHLIRYGSLRSTNFTKDRAAKPLERSEVVENGHLATSVKHSRAEELIQYTKASAEARSSRPDAPTHGVRIPGFGWRRPGASGRGPHLRIPERKQVNCYQAFIIASSLWPFRWWGPCRSGWGPATLSARRVMRRGRADEHGI